MKAYKFLASGAIAPFSGFAWPTPDGDRPGAWVEAGGPLAPCERGAHVCRPIDLAHWLHEELWELEVDGDRIDAIDGLIAQRARLVRRVDGWHQGGAARFGEACARHAAEVVDAASGSAGADVRGYLDDAAMAAQSGYPAVGAFAAALAVARVGDRADAGAAFRRERAWQSAWIARAFL